jgi:rhamnogalacturonyl hydrolase YesR
MKKIFSLLLVVLVTAAGYPAKKADPLFEKKNIKLAMTRAAQWQLKNPKHELNDWTNGAFYAGLMAAWQTTGSKELYQAMLAMGRKNEWKPAERLHHADDYAICQTYIDLYRIEKDPVMIKATVDSVNKMMQVPYPVGGIRKICWWWCDALFMAPPALVKLGVTLNDNKYLEFSDKLYKETVDLLWNEEDSLFARDLNYVWCSSEKNLQEANGYHIYWSRGNGWVMAGLARLLNELPKSDPNRGYYVELYRKMAKRIAALQQDDGLWRASLLDPKSYPGGEASGSGFYCFALAWGINNGILGKKEYLPVVKQAWRGLSSLITSEGYIGWVQPIGADPQKDFSPQSWEVYGTGAFLLAGSEVVKMKK